MKNFKINAYNAPAFVKHLQLLANLSTNPQEAGIYAFDIYQKLVKLERKATRYTTALCNGDIEEDKAEKALSKVRKEVKNLLPKINHFRLNYDPRGYALKISETEAKELGMYQDFGGYGILAPEF